VNAFFVDAPEERVETLGVFLAGEVSALGVRVFDPRHICFEYRVSNSHFDSVATLPGL